MYVCLIDCLRSFAAAIVVCQCRLFFNYREHTTKRLSKELTEPHAQDVHRVVMEAEHLDSKLFEPFLAVQWRKELERWRC